MTTQKSLKCSVNQDELIEVWKVLESLTVSLDRISEVWSSKGEEEAKTALLKYVAAEHLDPPLLTRIANARSILVKAFEDCNPELHKKLEQLVDEEKIDYWTG